MKKCTRTIITAALLATIGLIFGSRKTNAADLTEAAWYSSTTLNLDGGVSLAPTLQGAGVSITPNGRFGGGVLLVGNSTSGLTYNAPSCFNNSQGTVSFWYKPGVSSASLPTGSRILSIADPSGNRFVDIYYNNNGTSGPFMFDLTTHSGGGVQASSVNMTFSATDWLYFTVEWNSSSTQGVEIWVGKQSSGTAGNLYTNGATYTPMTSVASTINIGSWPPAGSSVNSPGIWDDLYVSDELLYPLTSSTITIPTSPLAIYGPSDDEFAGPFASWINVKTSSLVSPHAVGDGVTDDTAALQSALNAAAAGSLSGGQSVVYLPSGTYKITEGANNGNPLNIANGVRCGLALAATQYVGMIGQDPLTTTIKWGGASNSTDAMLWVDGVACSRYGRITWDGAGSTVTGFSQKWNHANTPNYASTANYHSDEVFQNMAIGIALGDPNTTNYGSSDGDNTIVRDHFFNCSQAGVRTGSYNAFCNYIWDSEFIDCGTGADDLGNGTNGGGNFNTYRCYFKNSSVADLHTLYAFWAGYRGNTSVGSNQFFRNDGFAQTDNLKVFEGNTILNSTDSETIAINELGNAFLLDNQICSLVGAGAPVVQMGWSGTGLNGQDLDSVGNSYTVSSPITVYGSTITSPPGAPRWWTQNDQVVSPGSISSTVPTMPGTPANLGRPSMDMTPNMSATATAAQIASAITWAQGYQGQHPIIHFPAGSYSINAMITIPLGLDVQLVGDGMASILNWTATTSGTILQLNGPSKAYIRDLHLACNASGHAAANAITITNPDQVGAKISIEGGIWEEFTGDALYVDGCKNAVVECHAFQVQGTYTAPSDTQLVANIVGGGGTGTGYTAIFGSDGGVYSANAALFAVSNNANLVVTDHYYEGNSPRIIQLSGNNTVTFSDEYYQYNVVPLMIVEDPPIELDTFTGTAAFINCGITRWTDTTTTHPQILVNGETSTTQALFLGTEVATGAASFTNYFSRTSSGGQVSLLNSKYTGVSGAAYQVTNQGNTPTAGFITSSLNQMSTIAPTFPTTSGTGITEVRLIDVNISEGAINCVQVGP